MSEYSNISLELYMMSYMDIRVLRKSIIRVFKGYYKTDIKDPKYTPILPLRDIHSSII